MYSLFTFFVLPLFKLIFLLHSFFSLFKNFKELDKLTSWFFSCFHIFKKTLVTTAFFNERVEKALQRR